VLGGVVLGGVVVERDPAKSAPPLPITPFSPTLVRLGVFFLGN